MAFGCVLNLKRECDGCMRCREPTAYSARSRGRHSPQDDDLYNPFEPDDMDIEFEIDMDVDYGRI